MTTPEGNHTHDFLTLVSPEEYIPASALSEEAQERIQADTETLNELIAVGAVDQALAEPYKAAFVKREKYMAAIPDWREDPDRFIREEFDACSQPPWRELEVGFPQAYFLLAKNDDVFVTTDAFPVPDGERGGQLLVISREGLASYADLAPERHRAVKFVMDRISEVLSEAYDGAEIYKGEHGNCGSLKPATGTVSCVKPSRAHMLMFTLPLGATQEQIVEETNYIADVRKIGINGTWKDNGNPAERDDVVDAVEGGYWKDHINLSGEVISLDDVLAENALLPTLEYPEVTRLEDLLPSDIVDKIPRNEHDDIRYIYGDALGLKYLIYGKDCGSQLHRQIYGRMYDPDVDTREGRWSRRRDREHTEELVVMRKAMPITANKLRAPLTQMQAEIDAANKKGVETYGLRTRICDIDAPNLGSIALQAIR